jgi:hypothetical protein
VKPSDKSSAAEESSAAAPESKDEAVKSKDVVLIHGITGDGQGLAVVRQREERLEFGAVHPLKDGKPIHGELVRLKPRPECPLVCDVEVAMAPSEAAPQRASSGPASARKGPAQVASAEYRENWDAIWKRPEKKPDLPN